MDIAALNSQPSVQSAGAFSSLAANFDTFLTLLTTQLRNQDPLDPLDTEKFTEQLVQFSAVEQSIKTNTHLEALVALQSASDRAGALSLVGRSATFASDKAALDGDDAAWRYTLPAGASAVALAVVDGNGAVVARAAGAQEAGTHDFIWNGDNAAPGVYRLVIDARSADGAVIDAEIETTATVSAVVFGSGAPSLETSAGMLPLDAVRRVGA